MKLQTHYYALKKHFPGRVSTLLRGMKAMAPGSEASYHQLQGLTKGHMSGGSRVLFCCGYPCSSFLYGATFGPYIL